MNPFVIELLTAVLRYVLVGVFGYLLAHHVITEDQQAKFLDYFTDAKVLSYIVGGLVTVGLAVRSVLRARLKLLTALATPAATSEQTVTALVKGGAAPPVTTPKAEVPVSPPPKE